MLLMHRVPRRSLRICGVLCLLVLLVGGPAVWWFAARPDAAELLDGAVAAIERDDSQTAVALLDSLLQREPDHGMALLYRGQLARDLGDPEAALAGWRRVADEPPNIGATARYLEGTLLLERGGAREAERVFRRAIDLNPQYVQAHERLLEMYVVQVRADDARHRLDEIGRLRDWTLNEMVFQIVPVERATHAESGAGMMRACLDANPDDFDCALALGRYLIEGERHGAAADGLRELRVAHPDSERVAALLAEALLKQDETEAAREILKRFPPEPASSSWLWQSHAHLAVALDDWEGAAACFYGAVEAEPENLSALYRLGDACRRLGRGEDARRFLERAQQMDRLQRQALRLVWGNQEQPELVLPILVEVGELLLQMDRPADAVHWFDRALTMDPPHHQARRRWEQARGLASIAAGRPAADAGDPPAATSPLAGPAAAIHAGSRGPARRAAGDPRPPRIRLRDVHADAGISFQYFNGESGYKYLLESTGGGVAVLDYDGDGWPDLYFPQGCPLPFNPADRTYTDRLYRNRGNGTFEDVTEAAGLGDHRYGQGIAVGDCNNDGFPDLVVANFGRNTFYRNNGDGTFSDVTDEVGLSGDEMSSSLALADLDGDGFLDLYVVNYLDSLKVCRTAEGTYHACSPTNFGAEQDRLYRNRGDGVFEDVTSSAGIVVADGKGLGIIVADLDDDGRPDVFVANDTTPNFLFRNQSDAHGIRFSEQALLSGVAVSGDGRAEAGMGVACADLNGSGRLDLYVTHFYLETNTLYRNHGSCLFVDATREAGLAEPTNPLLGFGTQAVDFALEGRPGLFVANGHIDNFEARGEPWKMLPQLFANVGRGRFVDVSRESGPYFDGRYLGRGAARLDFNRDGRPDLVVVHQDRPVALLLNETVEAGRGVVLELRGVESNRDAIGARIQVSAGGSVQTLEICGGDGFYSSNERRQFVGVADATRLDWLEIRWPGGRRERWTDLPVDSLLTCIEGRLPLIRPLER